MRVVLILAGAACALAVSACGGDASSSASGTPVRLTITAPEDLGSVRETSVQVRGTVRPASAEVIVRGEHAQVSGGAWSAQVRLEPGVNVVDVLASAGRARPAMTAVRVRRLEQVTVPDVTGLNADEAKSQLRQAHLEADLQTTGGGLIDELLGREPQVCATDPAAGDHVDPGTTVTVQLARRC
jgi:hypothetical protein